MASSDTQNLTFLCDKVLLDGHLLQPLNPEKNLVFLQVNVDTHEMEFVFKESFDGTAEKRDLVFKWEHIMGTSMSREYNDNLITFKLNRNLCGYALCNVFVSDLVFEPLSDVVDVMYFYIMRTRHGLNEAQAREHIRNVYVMEDTFGYEDDCLASTNDAESNSKTLSLSLADVEGSFQSQNSFSSQNEDVGNAQLTNDEKGQLTNDEKAQLTNDEKAQLTNDEKAQLTTDETAQLTNDEKAQLTTDEKAQLTTDEKVQLTNDEKAQLTNDEKAQLTNDEKAQLTNDEKAQLTNDEKAQEETSAVLDEKDTENKNI